MSEHAADALRAAPAFITTSAGLTVVHGGQAKAAELVASGPSEAIAALTAQYVRLPPGRRHVWTPVASRGAALAGIGLVTGSKLGALALHFAGYALVAAFGPRALPGRRVAWPPPMSELAWRGLIGELTSAVGEFDAMAIYQQPQTSRSGVALLLIARGRERAFVKLRRDARSVWREQLALAHFAAAPAETFVTPEPLGTGEVEGWHWLAMTPMPARLHRPQRRVPLDRLLEEVQAGLAAALPRDPALPPTWEPAHGDLTPWNLRRSAHQRRQPVALIDWEGAGWAPPGADRVYFRAVESVVFGAPVQAGPIEAVEYWLERARRRPASDYDGKFNARLVAVLEAMAAG